MTSDAVPGPPAEPPTRSDLRPSADGGAGTDGGAELAREALRRAREGARALTRGVEGPPRPAPVRRRAGPVSPPGVDTGPVALGEAVAGLLHERGWTPVAHAAGVISRWAEIVGADIAGHSRATALRDGVLTVEAESSAWATQLRLLAGQLLARIRAEVGESVVTRVDVRGPTGGPPRRGRLRVPGSRGPRDTYG